MKTFESPLYKTVGETLAWTLKYVAHKQLGNEQDDINGDKPWRLEKCCVWFQNRSNNSNPSQCCQKSLCLQLQTVQVLNISFSMYKLIHLYTYSKFNKNSLCRNEVKPIHSNFMINVNCLSPRAAATEESQNNST